MEEKLKQIYEERMKILVTGGSREDILTARGLARRGCWKPEWVAEEFAKVERKESAESARVRSLVRTVGMLASFAYLKVPKS